MTSRTSHPITKNCVPIASPCVELLSQYQRKSLWLKTAASRLQYVASPEADLVVLIVRMERATDSVLEAMVLIFYYQTHRQNRGGGEHLLNSRHSIIRPPKTSQVGTSEADIGSKKIVPLRLIDRDHYQANELLGLVIGVIYLRL